MLYEKEKKEKIEIIVDWIRRLIISKEKNHKVVVNLLEDDYINILNSIDFESPHISESCKKKLLELINWLPNINRYLFTKLSILILNKKTSLFNTNLILDILKSRLDSNSFDQSDYLMFLMNLFNGLFNLKFVFLFNFITELLC